MTTLDVSLFLTASSVNLTITLSIFTTLSNNGGEKVLERLEELASIYNVDISQNIIPEIFSKEMWDIVKESLQYQQYIFSHYFQNFFLLINQK